MLRYYSSSTILLFINFLILEGCYANELNDGNLTCRTSVNMLGTVKTVMRENLTSNSQIALSGEFNPFYDEYKFG